MGKVLFTIKVREGLRGGYFAKCETSSGRVYMESFASKDALAKWMGARGHHPIPGSPFPVASSPAARRIVERGMRGRR